MDREVDRCLECGDASGYFTVVYRAVTERVRDGIAAGDFADGEQMEHFDVLFAQRYLDARDVPTPRGQPRRLGVPGCRERGATRAGHQSGR